MPTQRGGERHDLRHGGRVAVLDGTGWATLDLKGTWKPVGQLSTHTLSSGVHYEHYSLKNTTFNTSELDRRRQPHRRVHRRRRQDARRRRSGLQDAWYITPDLKLTVGGRYEDWRGYDGLNVGQRPGPTRACVQPTVEGAEVLAEGAAHLERVGAVDVHRGARQGVPLRDGGGALSARLHRHDVHLAQSRTSSRTTCSSTELRVERKFERAQRAALAVPGRRARRDHLAVQHARAGLDAAVLVPLERRSRARARRRARVRHERRPDPGARASPATSRWSTRRRSRCRAARARRAAPDAAIGKQLPNIPKWRATATAMYRPTERFTFTLAGRYSSKLYTTLDNADVRYNTYQGFAEWFVMDTKANYQREPTTGTRRSAWTTCSTGSTSCSTRSRSAPSSRGSSTASSEPPLIDRTFVRPARARALLLGAVVAALASGHANPCARGASGAAHARHAPQIGAGQGQHRRDAGAHLPRLQ